MRKLGLDSVFPPQEKVSNLLLGYGTGSNPNKSQTPVMPNLPSIGQTPATPAPNTPKPAVVAPAPKPKLPKINTSAMKPRAM